MTLPINTHMSLREWALLVTLSLLWGGSFLFVGVAVRELPPFTIVALRVAVAALVLQAILRIIGVGSPRDRRLWAAFVGMGVLNNAIPFTLIAWGQSHIASGLASILNATTPLFTVLVAHAFTTDERMTGRRLVGVIVGFAGVAVMIGGAALQELGVHIAAQVAVLGAALSYGCAGVFGRRFGRLGVPPLATAAGQVTASSAILVPLALLMDRPWSLPTPSATTVAALLALAILSTAVAYLLFFRLLASAGATNVALVTFLIPVSAVVLGAVLLKERLEARHFAGMLLIAAGLAWIDGRAPAALSRLSGLGPASRETG
jgi:drug/metabolite transporter (DMT)-like permease